MVGTGRTALGILGEAQLAVGDVVIVTAAAGGLGTLLVQAASNAGCLVVGRRRRTGQGRARPIARCGHRGGLPTGRLGRRCEDPRSVIAPINVALDGVGGSDRTRRVRSGRSRRSNGAVRLHRRSPDGALRTDLFAHGVSVTAAIGPRMFARPGGIQGLAIEAVERLERRRLASGRRPFRARSCRRRPRRTRSPPHHRQGRPHPLTAPAPDRRRAASSCIRTRSAAGSRTRKSTSSMAMWNAIASRLSAPVVSSVVCSSIASSTATLGGTLAAICSTGASSSTLAWYRYGDVLIERCTRSTASGGSSTTNRCPVGCGRRDAIDAPRAPLRQPCVAGDEVPAAADAHDPIGEQPALGGAPVAVAIVHRELVGIAAGGADRPQDRAVDVVDVRLHGDHRCRQRHVACATARATSAPTCATARCGRLADALPGRRHAPARPGRTPRRCRASAAAPPTRRRRAGSRRWRPGRSRPGSRAGAADRCRGARCARSRPSRSASSGPVHDGRDCSAASTPSRRPVGPDMSSILSRTRTETVLHSSRTVDGMETTTSIDIDWNQELVDQLDWHWQHHLRPRLDGPHRRRVPVGAGARVLEPAAAVTRRRSPMAAGAGDTVADFEYPEPDPAPFTTIAWRMAHISIGVLGMRAANHFGEPGTVEYATTDWPLDRRRRAGVARPPLRRMDGGRPVARRRRSAPAAADRPRDRSPSTRWPRWCCTSPAR